MQLQMVYPDDSLLVDILPDLVANFREWEKRRREPDGLFWQYDGQDGMEVAIGVSYEGHECQWNGPSWPFATSQTLTAMANVLNDYAQDVITRDDFFNILKIYTNSHRFRQIPPDGNTIISNLLWIDENLNPFTGDWLARTHMEVQGHNHGFRERGIYYNHSTYNDIIITGLVGLRPSLDNKLIINPLIPDNWDWFCLDDVNYKGHKISII